MVAKVLLQAALTGTFTVKITDTRKRTPDGRARHRTQHSDLDISPLGVSRVPPELLPGVISCFIVPNRPRRKTTLNRL